MTLRESPIPPPRLLGSRRCGTPLTNFIWQTVRVYNTSWSLSPSWTGPLYIAIMPVITCPLTWSSRRVKVVGRSVAYGLIIKSMQEFFYGRAFKNGVLICNRGFGCGRLGYT